jgi:hypothetical protein
LITWVWKSMHRIIVIMNNVVRYSSRRQYVGAKYLLGEFSPAHEPVAAAIIEYLRLTDGTHCSRSKQHAAESDPPLSHLDKCSTWSPARTCLCRRHSSSAPCGPCLNQEDRIRVAYGTAHFSNHKVISIWIWLNVGRCCSCPRGCYTNEKRGLR